VKNKHAAQPNDASSHAWAWPQNASCQAWAPKSAWHKLQGAALQGNVQNAMETLSDLDMRLSCNAFALVTPQEWDSEPEHLNGALQLVPLTKDDVQDMELRPHHVIAMRKDISIIKEALAYISRRHGGRAAKE